MRYGCWLVKKKNYSSYASGTRTTLTKLLSCLKDTPSFADAESYTAAIKLCGHLSALSEGKWIHRRIIGSVLERDTFVCNHLMFMYGKCGNLDDAKKIFDKMEYRNIVTCNGMLMAYALNGHSHNTLHLFRQMQLDGAEVAASMFVTIFKACTKMAALKEATLFHSCLSESEFAYDIDANNAILNLYGKCGSVEDVQRVFQRMLIRDVISWTILIAAYAQRKNGKETIQWLRRMQFEGVHPNKVTLMSALEVCGRSEGVATGRRVHACICEIGYEADTVVGTTLIDMYTRCGSLDEAREVFEGMNNSLDVISWTAMIVAFVQHEKCREALDLFRRMQQQGVHPNYVTCVISLNACAAIAGLAEGKKIHATTIEAGYEDVHVNVGNALVNMYGNCGSLEIAKGIFDGMPRKDTVSWNALITTFARHGHGKEALNFFWMMQEEGFDADHITFVGVLSACSSTGLIAEGHSYYVTLLSDYRLMTTDQHFGCMADLLGRVGWLDEAEQLLHVMPFQPDESKWTALLGACKTHSDLERGLRAAERVLDLEPHNSSAYVVLSQMIQEEEDDDDLLLLVED